MATRTYRLLCIDDDAQSLQVRKVLLESYGFRVNTAGSGPEGLRAVRTLAPDAVVVDYHMPGMDGGEVAREMKNWDAALPVIILSALPWLPDDAPNDCIDSCVSKGEPMGALVQTIQSLIDERRHNGYRRGGRWPLRAARFAVGAAGVVAGAVVGLVQRKIHHPDKSVSRSAMA